MTPDTAPNGDQDRVTDSAATEDTWEALPCECGEACNGHGDRRSDDE